MENNLNKLEHNNQRENVKFYIARDKDGELYLYDDVPEKLIKCFVQQRYKEVMKLSNDLFPEVTFENSPQKVEFKLVNLCG